MVALCNVNRFKSQSSKILDIPIIKSKALNCKNNPVILFRRGLPDRPRGISRHRGTVGGKRLHVPQTVWVTGNNQPAELVEINLLKNHR